jgi:hypothetical protein
MKHSCECSEMDSSESVTGTYEEDKKWFGHSKEETVYLCQAVLLYIVIITCIINLSIDNGNSNLWTALLSSCLGYMLPNPNLKKMKWTQPARNT